MKNTFSLVLALASLSLASTGAEARIHIRDTGLGADNVGISDVIPEESSDGQICQNDNTILDIGEISGELRSTDCRINGYSCDFFFKVPAGAITLRSLISLLSPNRYIALSESQCSLLRNNGETRRPTRLSNSGYRIVSVKAEFSAYDSWRTEYASCQSDHDAASRSERISGSFSGNCVYRRDGSFAEAFSGITFFEYSDTPSVFKRERVNCNCDGSDQALSITARNLETIKETSGVPHTLP